MHLELHLLKKLEVFQPRQNVSVTIRQLGPPSFAQLTTVTRGYVLPFIYSSIRHSGVNPVWSLSIKNVHNLQLSLFIILAALSWKQSDFCLWTFSFRPVGNCSCRWKKFGMAAIKMLVVGSRYGPELWLACSVNSWSQHYSHAWLHMTVWVRSAAPFRERHHEGGSLRSPWHGWRL